MPASPVTPGHTLREAGLIALLAAAAFILLAMASYSPTDDAWSFRSSANATSNLVGRSGAWSADVLLTVLGWMAYVVPALLVTAGIRLFRGRHAPFSWTVTALRLAGWMGLLLGGCMLMRLHAAPTAPLPAGSGGIVGDFLVKAGLPVLNWVGLSLVAVVIAVVGAQAALGFSWVRLAETTGRWVYAGAAGVVMTLDRYRDLVVTRARRRAETRRSTAERRSAVVEERKRRKARTAPSIQPAPFGAEPGARSRKPLSRERQQKLFPVSGEGELPSLDLLDDQRFDARSGYSEQSLAAMSRLLELKLKDFGIEAEVVSVLPGPVVTRFELQPAPGIKVSRISGLVKDLARSLAVISVRVVEVIPGKSVVGIEIPNEHREIVRLKELFEAGAYQDARSPLTLALGKDIAGEPVVIDIARMPHLLVAGTTGSGKSVGVNAMLLSLLCKSTPDEVRLILVDPKMLELSIYEGVPHLLTPVVTDMKDAAQALAWCVGEMERRYRLMAALGVRNLAGFNRRVADAEKHGEPILDPLYPEEADGAAPTLVKLPTIVVVIDEFADMMMIVGKKVEQLIARIAQKARAAGIHLVLATQRPSVDVITGLIKANIPCRISFQVSSRVDSRTILDQGGAEQLLGHGDMLYLPPGTSMTRRIHGAFVSDDEVHRVVADWKKRGAPHYHEDVLSGSEEPLPGMPAGLGGTNDAEQDDALYDEAVAFVLDSRRASISSVQRKLRIGYNRAARLIEAMEGAGVVSEMGSNGSREVLVPKRD